MAINLASLILRVQSVLSDVPASYITDEQLYIDLKTAKVYLDSIKRVDYSNDSFEEETLVRLGAYFSYSNYTSLAERQLGTVPTTTDIKLQTLRRMALAFMRQMSDFQINDDLSVDKAKEAKAYTVAIGVTDSVFTDG